MTSEEKAEIMDLPPVKKTVIDEAIPTIKPKKERPPTKDTSGVKKEPEQKQAGAAPKNINVNNFLMTEQIKLKDSGDKGAVFINLDAEFGFRPQWIGVIKVMGTNNAIIVAAEKTPGMLHYEDTKYLAGLQEGLKRAKMEQINKDKAVDSVKKGIKNDKPN